MKIELKKGYLAFSLLLFLPLFSESQNIKNVNKSSTSEACHLLSFLYAVSGKYTLTAQHNFIASGSRYTDSIYKITGKYPLIWGSDFSFFYEGTEPRRYQHCGPMNLTDPGTPVSFTGLTPSPARQNMINHAIEKYKQGYIITLMWHACPPTIGGDSCNGDDIWTWNTGRNLSDSQWTQLLTDGSEMNKKWKQQVDNIAFYLKQLQHAHVPVLWRPYHEMNGTWFWWCNKKGENGFKKLWIMLYNYMVHVHHLNNLIWVWNTNAPRNIPGDEAGAYDDFYPGKDYVDILTADVYRNDWKQSHHNDLLKLANGKPIALGEVGNMPSPAILHSQPSWTWFMPWGNLAIRNNSIEAIKAIYAEPSVITKDKVHIDKRGNYHLQIK